MDRCWFSDDGYQVTSRILITDWGKVEHAAITYNGDEENLFSFDGSRDIPWSVKQEIKNEVFGEKRLAIEVFPAETNKVDGSAKEKKKENISKTENFIRDWIASETNSPVSN